MRRTPPQPETPDDDLAQEFWEEEITQVAPRLTMAELLAGAEAMSVAAPVAFHRQG